VPVDDGYGGNQSAVPRGARRCFRTL